MALFPKGIIGNYNFGNDASTDWAIDRVKEIESYVMQSKENIDKNRNDINETEYAVNLINTDIIKLESGTYTDATGTVKINNNARLRCVTPIPLNNFESIEMPDGYSMYLFKLDSNFNLLGTLYWSTYREKAIFGNASYFTFSIRKTSAPTENISSQLTTVQSGIIYKTRLNNLYSDNNMQNTALRESLGVLVQPSAIASNYALHDTGVCSGKSGINLVKYEVTPGSNIFLYATVDNSETWQGVYQFQSAASVPTSNNTNLIGKTSTNAINNYITVPEGATWLILSISSNDTWSGIYDIDLRQYASSSKNIVSRYINDNTLIDIKSLQKEYEIGASKNFIFFSDIHAGATNYKRIIDYANALGAGKVNAIINGGDTVQSYVTDNIDWYNNTTAETDINVLTCVGNHDVWETSAFNMADSTTVYNKFIKPMVTRNVPIQQPTGAETDGLNYYYIDYGSVRVIVLAAMYYTSTEQMYWTSAQKTWLINTLANAKTNSKEVICVNHAPYMKTKAQIDGALPLNSWRNYNNNSIFDGMCVAQEAVDAVHDFIDDGGTFICWLTGHLHQDDIMFESTYEDQFMISIASAKYMYHSDGYSPDSTEYNAKGYDCFDYISVDTVNKMMKVLRIGYNEDASMRIRNRWCFNYSNNQLLSYS